MLIKREKSYLYCTIRAFPLVPSLLTKKYIEVHLKETKHKISTIAPSTIYHIHFKQIRFSRDLKVDREKLTWREGGMMNAVSVQWNDLNLDWNSLQMPVLSQKEKISEDTTFSTVFYRKGRYEISLIIT